MRKRRRQYADAFGKILLGLRTLRNGRRGARLIAADVAPYADELRTDRSGNLIAFKKGRKPRTEKLLFSAHMDEVGFMVTHISEDGFAYFGTIGGIDPRVVAGKRVVLGDKRLPGVIAAKAIHMQKPEERGVPAPVDEMFIDIGCISEENTKALVSVGDCAVFAPNYEAFGDGFIKSKAIDDRFGCAVLVKLLQSELEYDTYFAFCTAEEVGCRGAATVGQAIGAGTVIVLEATTAGDIPARRKAGSPAVSARARLSRLWTAVPSIRAS